MATVFSGLLSALIKTTEAVSPFSSLTYFTLCMGTTMQSSDWLATKEEASHTPSSREPS